jgi:octaheme c-type cytochrome (tetrathionate reductase family)
MLKKARIALLALAAGAALTVAAVATATATATSVASPANPAPAAKPAVAVAVPTSTVAAPTTAAVAAPSAALQPPAAVAPAAPAPTPVPLLSERSAEYKKGASTADHGKFKELQKDFKTGPEVTKACLECHTEAAHQVQHTKHWTWDVVNPESKKKLGKKNIINNYCTSPISNEKDCMACHAGYGWKDGSYDFSKEDNVDCLICHDSTGTYRKLPGDAGHPVYERREFPAGSGKFVEAVDLTKVAQKVALPSRANCGSCHFYGAGGDGTKHGDLDSSLKKPGKYLDVHMDAEGLNFSCSTCHATRSHQVAGSRYQMDAALKGGVYTRGKADESPASCQSCHSNKPHNARHSLLNDHTEKVACQTCHIPAFARNAIGTEMRWDWSTATKMGPDGKPLVVKDSAGRRAFDSKKGHFVWDSYVTPRYIWFNGKMDYKVQGDKIDPSKVVQINTPGGSPGSPDSRIWPMKVHTGKQAYDPVNKTLIVTHTAGEDETALWHNFDWKKAIGTGMKAANLPWSGEYDFVSTEMWWPITHMVAPEHDALACEQCHSDNGRLAGITGIYMPGRDHHRLVDLIGGGIALLTLLGALIHGSLRCCSFGRKEK